MIMKMPSCYGIYAYFPNSDSGDEYEDQDDYFVEEQENFEEYEWMVNEEEFDKQEMQRLEEEELMRDAMEAMLMDEAAEREAELFENESNLSQIFSTISIQMADVENSTLNPLAEEFIPSFRPMHFKK